MNYLLQAAKIFQKLISKIENNKFRNYISSLLLNFQNFLYYKKKLQTNSLKFNSIESILLNNDFKIKRNC